MNDYNILADLIKNEYINRITGKDIDERLIGEDPEERVMAGMLAEGRVDRTLTNGYVESDSKKFESVPSMSLSFKVSKKSTGSIKITPNGLLFYSVVPTYEETCNYALNIYSKQNNKKYDDIKQILNEENSFEVPKAYKKIDISDFFNEGIKIDINGLHEKKWNLENEISNTLNVLEDQIMEEIRIVPDTKIQPSILETKEKYEVFVKPKNVSVHPNWVIDILCDVKEENDCFSFFLQLVNLTKSDKFIGYSPRVFNAGITVVGDENIIFEEIEMDYLKTTFKEKEKIFSISENTSSRYEEHDNCIRTENVPIFAQYRTVTRDEFSSLLTFESLIEKPVENLTFIRDKMLEDFDTCEKNYRNIQNLENKAKEKFEESFEDYRSEIDRFSDGIEQIKYKEHVRKSFECMNRTFSCEIGGRKNNIKGWRLFQIVFIVSQICELIRSEYRDDESAAMKAVDRDVTELLYFPTGGGKTEAFLGTVVFDMFFDRFRGKNYGVSAILKYPLRLLAVQQLDRVLTVVIKANTIREQIEELKDSNEFQLGFYVGSNIVPNDIKKDNINIIEGDTPSLNESYRLVDICPVCGKSIDVVFDKNGWKLSHVCNNPECNIKRLPLLIIDDEVYRYLPSIMVCTIDKMATVGLNERFKLIFGQAKTRCSLHGFSTTEKCRCPNCNGSVDKINDLKDPAPTLFIQDELHLAKESLGTFDSHYESFIKNYIETLMPEKQRKRIRYIGATATISVYEKHIQHLYHMEGRRFPCEYPSVKDGENFYSKTDYNDVSRYILGYAPYGRSITDGVWQSVYIMRLIVYSMLANIDETYSKLVNFDSSKEQLKDMLYNYWIELVYNNRKDDVMNLYNAFNNQANNFLSEKNIPVFVSENMTSDENFQVVRKTLFDIDKNRKDVNKTNLILATSTISHGVDEDSFNLMFFYGMPNTNAEYIQAYSRVGRKYTGIVIDIIRLMRLRDRSYLKNFTVFHNNKDDLVEMVPIYRWARNAIYWTLPGILCALYLQYYAPKHNVDNPYNAIKFQKLLQDGAIDIKEVVDIIKNSYGCTLSEKESIFYSEIIEEEVYSILDGIKNSTFDNKEMIGKAVSRFSKQNIEPMRSLRDTEEQIEIRIS